MKCKSIIHAVGPRYAKKNHGRSEALLQATVINTLQKAKELKARTISIPAISSGIFGFPKDKCTEIMLKNTVNWLALTLVDVEEEDCSVKIVRLCNFDDKTVNWF